MFLSWNLINELSWLTVENLPHTIWVSENDEAIISSKVKKDLWLFFLTQMLKTFNEVLRNWIFLVLIVVFNNFEKFRAGSHKWEREANTLNALARIEPISVVSCPESCD